MSFLGTAAALAMIARSARGDDICPGMLTTKVSWDDVIDREACFAATTVLARIIVASEDLAPGEAHMWSWTMDLDFEPDDRGPGDLLRDSPQVTTPVRHHRSLSPKNQHDRAPCSAYVDRFEIRVEDQDRCVHVTSAIRGIIA